MTTTPARTEAPDGGLVVHLDAPLPAELAVGAGTALFVVGTCFALEERIASLSLLVDGDEQPVMAHGMPRLDLLHAREEEPTSYRSGFWGIARVPSTANGAASAASRSRPRASGSTSRRRRRPPVRSSRSA
jgi:hypothetical protein